MVRRMPQPDLGVLGGRYALVDRIGRGGMGAVWRARDRLLSRDVAVKEILLPQGLDDEQLAITRGRALREARAAAQVRHPAVVTIHDVVIEDGHPWIVMDFVRARSLADRLEEAGALPVAEVARIGEALAGALRAIHDKGIVHRDLKPANVLIDTDGHVVLTDFGIATIEGEVRFTASGLLIGTPGFMAPERLAGEPSGPPSDLWSLGAVLYGAVEGHSPYEGSTPMVIASAVLTHDPAPPRRAGPLGPVITDLLARDPADRPDAQHAADRLAAFRTAPEAPSGRADPGRPPTTQEWSGAVHPPGPPGRRFRDERVPPGPAGRPTPGTRRTPAPGGREFGAVPAWLHQPATVRAAERTPRWWSRLLSPAWVAAAVVTVALGGGIAWLVSSASPGDPAASAVDPCTLLSANQVQQLAPGAQKISMPGEHGTAGCVWDGGGGHLSVNLASFSNEKAATTALHNGQGHFAAEPSLDISGVGNEVYAFADKANGQVVVLFRRDRHYVEVDYDGPTSTEQSNAFQAARWVDGSLGVLGR
jgi:hypothetical protein